MHHTRPSPPQSVMANLIPTILLLFTSPATAAKFTNADWHVKPGEIFTITWEALGIWSNISLMEGEPTTMTEFPLVTRHPTLNFDWRVPDWLDARYMLPNNTTSYLYALRISDSSEATDYSPPLQLKVETNTTSNVTTAEDTTNATASSSTDLSTAAKAGIGVGAGVLAIIILAVMGYYFYNRGKKVEASRNGWTKYSTGSSASTNDLESGSPVSPLSPTKPEELHADEKPTPELEVVESPVELGTATAWELSTGEKCIEEMEREFPRQGNQSLERKDGNDTAIRPGKNELSCAGKEKESIEKLQVDMKSTTNVSNE